MSHIWMSHVLGGPHRARLGARTSATLNHGPCRSSFFFPPPFFFQFSSYFSIFSAFFQFVLHISDSRSWQCTSMHLSFFFFPPPFFFFSSLQHCKAHVWISFMDTVSVFFSLIKFSISLVYQRLLIMNPVDVCIFFWHFFFKFARTWSVSWTCWSETFQQFTFSFFFPHIAISHVMRVRANLKKKMPKKNAYIYRVHDEESLIYERNWKFYEGKKSCYACHDIPLWVADTYMSHVTHLNWSCHTCGWVMSHIWMSAALSWCGTNHYVIMIICAKKTITQIKFLRRTHYYAPLIITCH